MCESQTQIPGLDNCAVMIHYQHVWKCRVVCIIGFAKRVDGKTKSKQGTDRTLLN